MASTNDNDHHKGQQPNKSSKKPSYETSKYCRVDHEEPKPHLSYVRLGASVYYLRCRTDIASQN